MWICKTLQIVFFGIHNPKSAEIVHAYQYCLKVVSFVCNVFSLTWILFHEFQIDQISKLRSQVSQQSENRSVHVKTKWIVQLVWAVHSKVEIITLLLENISSQSFIGIISATLFFMKNQTEICRKINKLSVRKGTEGGGEVGLGVGDAAKLLCVSNPAFEGLNALGF